jgi:large subunit ribosomal protein L21
MYAIIASGGKQHRVTAGDLLKVERLEAQAGEELSFRPLLVVDGESVYSADGASAFTVKAKVVGEGKHRKILVFHKKRRKQYKKIYGHRQPYTQIEILGIARD